MDLLTLDFASRGLAFALGIFLFISTAISVMRTVIIPRALRSIISDTVAWVIISTARMLTRLTRTYRRRDSIMAWAGPSILLWQLIVWLLLFLFAYGLMIYGVGSQSLGDSIRQAGSSLFTLGFASVNTEDQTIIDFMAAATGPIVIALMIGFLPNIYGTYTDREVDVTRLSAVAGEPAWGPEFLVRHYLSGRLEEVPVDFVDWAHWASRLRMTHVTYPILIWVRSARMSRHYAIALLTVLDAAALQISLSNTLPRREASRLILEGGQTFEVLQLVHDPKPRFRTTIPFAGLFSDRSPEIQRTERSLPSWNSGVTAVQMAADQDIMRGFDASMVEALSKGDAAPLRMTRIEFEHAYDYIVGSGFPVDQDLETAWKQFQVERGRYEYPALELCKYLDATPAPWSGVRRIATPTMWPTLAADVHRKLQGKDDGGAE